MAKGNQGLYDDLPPTVDRLKVMIEALASGEMLEAPLRAEIIDALKRHWARHDNDRIKARGRPIDVDAWLAASLTKHLLETGMGNLKRCARSAAEAIEWKNGHERSKVTAQDVLAVERNYNKLKKGENGFIFQSNGDKFCVAFISPTLLQAAEALLNRQNLDGLLPGEAGGVIARLYDPT